MNFAPRPGREFTIPTPADLKKRATVVAAANPAPILGPQRHPDATYWIETNAGIAFQHAGCLTLLTDHYKNQIHVVDDVHAEWAHKAAQTRRPPDPWSTDEVLQAHTKWSRVVAACGVLADAGHALLGEPVDLPTEEVDAVRKLRDELTAMPEADPPLRANDAWTHLGECATVRAAQLKLRAHTSAPLAEGEERPPLVQVLVSNDHKALKLAKRNGLGTRTTADVLREMVLENVLGINANQAWRLHRVTEEVATLPKELRPLGPEYFQN